MAKRHGLSDMIEQDRLSAWFQSDDGPRRRAVSDVVLAGTLAVPEAPAAVLADWHQEASANLMLAPGDVEVMPLTRTRWRWPDYPHCLQAASGWTHALGLPSILDHGDVALMACRGAHYHHDASQYGDAAFCNLFVSEDRGLDVHFPFIDRRIPLTRGTALIFDTGQPHGVIRRGSSGFDPADFVSSQDFLQIFLTWELPIGHALVQQALQLAPDTAVAAAAPGDGALRLNGAPVAVCPGSGRWRPAD